jgi:HSP20 family protein
MRIGGLANSRSGMDDLFERFLKGEVGSPDWPAGGYEVPTEVFHTDNNLVIRMDLPGVDPQEVEVTVQENVLLINGTRRFPFEAEEIRFVRRGTFYGDFTQRVSLGRGLDVEAIKAGYDNGVLQLTIPYSEEVQPKKISIEVGTQPALQN